MRHSVQAVTDDRNSMHHAVKPMVLAIGLTCGTVILLVTVSVVATLIFKKWKASSGSKYLSPARISSSIAPGQAPKALDRA